MDQQSSKGCIPTEPLPEIEEVTEDSDDVWLDEHVVESAITPTFNESLRSDDSSPLERLVKSISSDGEQWPVDEGQTCGSLPAARSRTKTYYDPTRPAVRETKERQGSRGSTDHDSDDEVNTSPKKRLVEVTENAIVPFTSVVFYRYLFGKGFGNFKKIGGTPPEADVHGVPHDDDFEMSKENGNNDSTVSGSSILANGTDVIEVPNKTEKAENLPLFLMEKLKNVFSRGQRDHMETPNLCPLCGNDVSGLTVTEVRSRVKALKTSQVQWLAEKYARLVSAYPKEVYKTELRIESDGSHSLSESYYRQSKPF